MTKITALEAWGQTALRPVSLPSGLKALITLPDVSMLIRAGKMPQELTNVAMKFATTGVQVSKLKPDEILEFLRMTYVLIAESIRYLATEDSPAWDEFRKTGAEPSAEGWEPVTLTGPQIAEMNIDQSDLEALGAIVARAKTTNEVTIASRLDRGLIAGKEPVDETVDDERRVSDYGPFRGEPGSSDTRTDGEDVRDAPERAPARAGSGHRARSRSGRRA